MQLTTGISLQQRMLSTTTPPWRAGAVYVWAARRNIASNTEFLREHQGEMHWCTGEKADGEVCEDLFATT